MEEISKIAERLKIAREHYIQAMNALAPKHTDGEIEKFKAAQKEKTALEREYSMANGWETAFKIDWQPKWDTGAPCPYVISTEGSIFLIYFIDEFDPEWDGKYIKIIDPKSDQANPLALVEFKRCYAYKFGGMNDEVWAGHPLYERGLESYAAHIIENSEWLKQEKRINSVHRGYKEEHWLEKKHYFLLFHDDMFECLAEGFNIEVHKDSFENVVKLATGRLFKNS